MVCQDAEDGGIADLYSLHTHYTLTIQDAEDGGIADRPGNMADVYHTFFGICGLSLLGHFQDEAKYPGFRSIDPTYALPTETIARLGLKPAAIAADS
jgi:geranylgeranyl transferase type-2 subunit beta